MILETTDTEGLYYLPNNGHPIFKPVGTAYFTGMFYGLGLKVGSNVMYIADLGRSRSYGDELHELFRRQALWVLYTELLTVNDLKWIEYCTKIAHELKK